jgi:hypothetical protein
MTWSVSYHLTEADNGHCITFDTREQAQAFYGELGRREALSRVIRQDGGELEFFAPPVEQRNLFQEGVCRPGWVEGMPLPAAKPLYEPQARICGECGALVLNSWERGPHACDTKGGA